MNTFGTLGTPGAGRTCKEKASSVVKGLAQEIAEQAGNLEQDIETRLNDYYVTQPKTEQIDKGQAVELWPPYFDKLRSDLWKIRKALANILITLNKTEL